MASAGGKIIQQKPLFTRLLCYVLKFSYINPLYDYLLTGNGPFSLSDLRLFMFPVVKNPRKAPQKASVVGKIIHKTHYSLEYFVTFCNFHTLTPKTILCYLGM